jgi:hypothetical protein
MQGARCNTMQDKERFGFEITSILILKMHQDLKNEIMLMDFIIKYFQDSGMFCWGQDPSGDRQESLQKSKPLINRE